MPRRRSFQFSLLGLFIAMTLAAIFCAVFFAAPIWAGVLVALFFAVSAPGILTTMICNGHAYARAFAVGAIFPAGWGMFFGFYLWAGLLSELDSEQRWMFLLCFGIWLVMIIGSGSTAVATRWLIERPRRLRDAARREARLRETEEE